MTRKNPVPLASDLERLLASLDIPQLALLVSLHKSWGDIAGPLVSAKAVPAKFRNGVLTVVVRNHSWAQELQLCKPALLAKVVAATGPESPVTDLRFIVGTAPSLEADAEPGEAPAPPEDGAVPEPEGLDAVSDGETRDCLRAISRLVRRRKR